MYAPNKSQKLLLNNQFNHQKMSNQSFKKVICATSHLKKVDFETPFASTGRLVIAIKCYICTYLELSLKIWYQAFPTLVF